MEAHGGYLSTLERYEADSLVSLARQALAEEGREAQSCALAISRLPGQRVVRLAFDSPHTYGRRGALWYQEHHALARLLSAQLDHRVHAYAIDPEEFEQVSSYASGRCVGGDRLRYDDVDLPAPDAFDSIQDAWPLAHLAKILGVRRDDLVQLARAPTVLLELGGD